MNSITIIFLEPEIIQEGGYLSERYPQHVGKYFICSKMTLDGEEYGHADIIHPDRMNRGSILSVRHCALKAFSRSVGYEIERERNK